MPDSLRRVNPVLPDVLDGRVWEGQNQGGKKNRGRMRGPETAKPDAEPEKEDEAAPAGRIDVRV